MEILILLGLVLLNGVFAMSELAVLASRKPRLQHEADRGEAGAQVALKLAQEPTAFLSTVQIGITMVGILAGAVGEAALAQDFTDWLIVQGMSPGAAQVLAFFLVVAVIAYFSLVLGELVPKRVALRHPEPIAKFVARPMALLAKLGHPVVRLLSFSTDAVLRLFGERGREEPSVTEEEVRVLLEQGAEAGVFEPVEKEMMENVLRLGDQRVASIMTLRNEIAYLDIEESAEETRRKLIESSVSRLPVCRGDIDHVMGFVQAKDLLAHLLKAEDLDLVAAVRQPLFVPRSITTMRLLEQFKISKVHIAIVTDEHGDTAGVVTLDDVLESVAGEFPRPDEEFDPDIVQREDGSWLLSGQVDVARFRDLLKLGPLPDQERGNYHTVAGFVMVQLGKVPVVGDILHWQQLRIEVVDMDGNRVDRVLVSAEPATPDPPRTE